ncbi:MAG: TonB-dependent receptor [Pseudomonadota bacterium]
MARRLSTLNWYQWLLLGMTSSLAIALPVVSLTSVAMAQAQNQSIDLPAGSLVDTLIALGDVLGVNIMTPEDLVMDKTAPAITGALTAEEAIGQALSGSGLVAKKAPGGAYVIARQKEATLKPKVQQPVVDETIIVTGTKRGLSLQETYTSVSVLTEKQLDERAIYELDDILLRTPGITTANEGLSDFAIRGVGSGGVRGDNTSGRTSNVYLDGAPITTEGGQSAFNLWDVSQVEVLRGPQSTIQGRNALAGAIVIQTADPEYEFGARLRGLIAEDNTYQGSAMVTGPILADQIAFRIAADYREVDFNTLDVPTNTRQGVTEATTIRAKLLIEPKALDGLRLKLGIQYVDFFTSGNNRRFDFPRFGLDEPEGFDVFDRTTTRVGLVDNENIRYFAEAQYAFSPQWEMVTLVTYDDTQRALSSIPNEITIDSSDVRTDEVFTIDSRVRFDYPNVRGWIGGYFYDETLNSNVNATRDLNGAGIPTMPAGVTFNQLSNRDIKTQNYAAYADITVDLTDKLSLNFGARYDWESVSDTGIDGDLVFSDDTCMAGPPFIDVLLPCDTLLRSVFPVSQGLFEEADYEAFLPRGSVVYRFDEDRSLSFTVARGYRAGGFNPGSEVIEEFDPEFLTNYELALRSQWFDRRLTVNANVFYSDYDDIQVLQPTPLGFTTEVINGAKAELYGAELSVSYKLTPALSVFADLALLETEFIDFPFAVDGPDTRNPLPGVEGFANLAGNSFAQAPGVSGAFGANYDDGRFFGSFVVNYSDGVFSDFTNLEPDRTDSYFLTNARIGYKFGKARISVFAENLFNAEFISSVRSQAVNILDVDGQGQVVLGPDNVGLAILSPPRTIGAEFEISF